MINRLSKLLPGNTLRWSSPSSIWVLGTLIVRFSCRISILSVNYHVKQRDGDSSDMMMFEISVRRQTYEDRQWQKTQHKTVETSVGYPRACPVDHLQPLWSPFISLFYLFLVSISERLKDRNWQQLEKDNSLCTQFIGNSINSNISVMIVWVNEGNLFLRSTCPSDFLRRRHSNSAESLKRNPSVFFSNSLIIHKIKTCVFISVVIVKAGWWDWGESEIWMSDITTQQHFVSSPVWFQEAAQFSNCCHEGTEWYCGRLGCHKLTYCLFYWFVQGILSRRWSDIGLSDQPAVGLFLNCLSNLQSAFDTVQSHLIHLRRVLNAE